MIDLTGHELGRYRIVGPLGRGGMAAVFRAFDPKVRREVAIKVLPPEMAEGDADYVARFEREAQVIASLDHPNIVPVFDFGEASSYTYMVMPLVAGGSLDARVEEARRGGRHLPLEEVARIVTEVASALSYAHGRGLVHRDLKPSNVLIDEQGRCRLADFGIARLLASSTRLTQSGALMGTPRYMSPEQALGKPTDGSTDIYALGVVLYELLTNTAPFDAETPLAVLMKHVNDPLPLPRALRPDLPEAVEGVVLKAMAKDPNQRWEDALELADAFRSAVGLDSGSIPAAVSTHTLAGPTVVTGAAPPAPPDAPSATSAPSASVPKAAIPLGSPSASGTAPPLSPATTSTYAPVRLSRGVLFLALAGVAVLLLLLVVAGGLFFWLRSRQPAERPVSGVSSPIASGAIDGDASARGAGGPDGDVGSAIGDRVTLESLATEGTARDEAEGADTAPSPSPSAPVATATPPRRARLAIEASREGVEIAVDGRRRGTAPLTVEVDAGRRTVTATLAGCEPSSRAVDVATAADRPLRFELDCPELERQARQAERSRAAQRVESIDEGSASAQEKAEAWQGFLAEWADDPDSDDALRRRARQRIEHWTAQARRAIVSWKPIPAGSFQMGCTAGDRDCYDDEEPAHAVRITRSFELAETETTNAQYRQCVDAGKCELPGSRGLFDDAELSRHPVVGVTWLDASAFCAFVGGRLPSEAEWEHAARGGRRGARYPWGDQLTHDDANWEDDGGRDVWDRTSPVGSFPANGYGLRDMAGNVFEWVADWYDDEFYRASPSSDPRGAPAGEDRVLRGGSWDNGPKALRVSKREHEEPDSRDREWGFRCARTPSDG